MKKIIKYMVFVLLVGVIFGISSNVYALDYEYGLYCGYGDYYFIYSGGFKEDKFNVDTNFFEELGINIEENRPLNSPMIAEDEQEWLKSNGLLDSNGYFTCPTNPFNSNLGAATLKECGSEGCKVINVESQYNTYTCNYVGQGTGKKLSIKSIFDEQGSRKEITYPDGSTATLTGSQLNGHLWPNENCNDIYYVTTTKQIKVAIDANEGVTNNATLSGLCDSHRQYEIEHYCSGECTYPEMVCSSDYDGTVFETDENGCPRALRPIIFFVKKLVFNTLQIFIPIILILMGTIDLVRATISSDDKSNKEAISKFIKRVLAAVFMFFIVTIVTVVMNMFSSTDAGAKDDWKACWHSID